MMKKQTNQFPGEFIYSALSTHEKIIFDLKHLFRGRKINVHSLVRKFSVLFVFITFVIGLFFVVKASQIAFPVREAYDKTGFVSADDFTTQFGSETILENDRFTFTFDNNLTTFVLTDNTTSKSWRSNPDTTSSRFLSPIKLYYAGSLGKVMPIGVKEKAVDYDDYSVRIDGNTLEVLYEVGGKKDVDSSDFPAIITAERMQLLILSKLETGTTDYRRITEQAYVSGNVSGVDVWKLKDGIQTSILKTLYRIMYETCGYTVEELAIDNAEHDIVVEDIYPYFEIAISYELTDKGLQVRIINSSIVEKEKYPLVYVDVLPYFGAGLLDDDGYLFVPDGSGGLIDFNNNRSFALPYNQRVYGRDLAKINLAKSSQNPKIHLPVIGMVNNGNAFISIAEEGAEMANVLANISTQDNPYNQVYYRYNIREGEVYEFSSINSSVSINQWTIWYNPLDFVCDYRFIEESDATYSDLAKEYQESLISQGILTNRDFTVSPVLDLTLLGGYILDENFLGIPYKEVKALTDTFQAQNIVSSLLSDGISDINLFYSGFSNDGLKPFYMKNLSFEKNVGSRNDFLALSTYLSDQNVSFYPEVLAATAYTDKRIKEKNFAIRNVFGNVVSNYGFNEASLYQDMTTRIWYPLKPETFETTISGLEKDLNDINVNRVLFADLGNQIYGSYRKKDNTFRSDYLRAFYAVMDTTSFEAIAFRDPNLYAIRYAEVVTDIDVVATDYQIITDSVPFFQLVFSGYLDYSGKSMNIDDQHSYRFHVMKDIETLSNLSMTWSALSTIDLVDTEYSYYYSTYYQNWYQTLLETYEEINALGVFNLSLADHELLTSDGLVSASTYSDGTRIVFNYRGSAYDYQGTLVPPMNYLVVQEGA